MAIAASPDLTSRARAAARLLATASRGAKDAALEAIAERLAAAAGDVIAANEVDLAAARETGTSDALLDRLTLDEQRTAALVDALRAVVALPDPIGEVVAGWRLPNGLDVQKVRVPLGVLLVVYEARPNVTVDVAALCLKSGNACLLRGSRSAARTNQALVEVVRDGLADAGLPEDAVLPFAASRDELAAFVARPDACDVVIPRGGEALKHFLLEHARVPVLAAAGGNCHVYLHADADPAKALPIVLNAKVQRPSVCNAAETLLVHRDALPLLGPIGAALQDAGVELRADDEAALALGVPSEPASEEDWGTEYLDLVLAVRTVGSVEEAIDHVERYGTGHSEAIVTESLAAADSFTRGISSACVYVNASTRFTDGGEFGFGAEIANATSRLHARGPIGLADITTTKYVVRGDGQIRERRAVAGRTFVVGYDGSAEAERALGRAAELAAALGAVLVVAEIAAPMLPPADIGAFGAFDLPYPPPGAESDVTDAIWERHRVHVAEVLDGRNVAHDFVSSRGDAAPALMALAEQRGAELIVVGTREAGFFDRLLTGSVSGEVARKAHCDVLIVHGHADPSG